MTLENIILELTSQTPSGGVCKIGDATFKVWYCSDIWEWEYQGVTYFDPLDLAEAMIQGTPAGSGPVQTPARTRRSPRPRPQLNRRPHLDAGA